MIKYIFSWIIIIFMLCCIFGCAKSTPATETIANSATESLNSLESTLTPECKTKAIESQINATKMAIKATVSACESEKAVITQEKLRWKWSFFATLIIIAVYIAKKVLK
jgi:hypothetical protein